MVNNILTFTIILISYFGFAAGLGILMHATNQKGRIYRLIYFVFVMLPFSFSLPWQWVIKIPVWALAGSVALFASKIPNYSMQKVWQKKILFSYFVLLTMLIMIWSALYGQGYAWLWIGLPAAITCMVCLAHIRQTNVI